MARQRILVGIAAVIGLGLTALLLSHNWHEPATAPRPAERGPRRQMRVQSLKNGANRGPAPTAGR